MAWPPKTIADYIEHGPKIAALCEFAEEMMRLKVLSNTGGALLRRSPATKSYALDQRGTEGSAFPDIANNAGKVLGTDGVTTSWVPQGARFITTVNRNNQSLANATGTALSFNVTQENDYGLWNAAVNPTRLTIPAAAGGVTYAGRWEFWAFITYNTNATSGRFAYVTKNGSTVSIVCQQAVSGLGTIVGVSGQTTMAAGDYFELFGQQWSGGALDVLASQLTVIRIGD